MDSAPGSVAGEGFPLKWPVQSRAVVGQSGAEHIRRGICATRLRASLRAQSRRNDPRRLHQPEHLPGIESRRLLPVPEGGAMIAPNAPRIGAGAVVCSGVPDYAVVARVPARVLRYRPGV